MFPSSPQNDSVSDTECWDISACAWLIAFIFPLDISRYRFFKIEE